MAAAAANPPRGALIGCGFFAQNQLHAWRDLGGAGPSPIAALVDPDAARLAATADRFGLPAAATFPSVAALLAAPLAASLTFFDVCTQPDTHRAIVEEIAAAAGKRTTTIICQKPLAPTAEDVAAMVACCEAAGAVLVVHENFRFQPPMRALAEQLRLLAEPLTFLRVAFRSAYNVYANQPYLAETPQFIIADLGVHALDIARFLLGTAARAGGSAAADFDSMYCTTQRVNPAIAGEDAATMILRCATPDGSGVSAAATCVVDISYGAQLEQELFPQTLVHLETASASIDLLANYELRIHVRPASPAARRDPPLPHQLFCPPVARPWMAAPGTLIQDSVVAFQRHVLDCLLAGTPERIETVASDNTKTLGLVFAAYESAASNAVVMLPKHKLSLV